MIRRLIMTKEEATQILTAYAGAEAQEYISAVEDYGDDTPEYWARFATADALIEEYNLFDTFMNEGD